MAVGSVEGARIFRDILGDFFRDSERIFGFRLGFSGILRRFLAFFGILWDSFGISRNLQEISMDSLDNIRIFRDFFRNFQRIFGFRLGFFGILRGFLGFFGIDLGFS